MRQPPPKPRHQSKTTQDGTGLLLDRVTTRYRTPVAHFAYHVVDMSIAAVLLFQHNGQRTTTAAIDRLLDEAEPGYLAQYPAAGNQGRSFGDGVLKPEYKTSRWAVFRCLRSPQQ